MKAHQTPFQLFDIEALIGPDERAIRDRVRAFTAEYVRPFTQQWFETGASPVRELARKLGQRGLLGMHLDSHGCAGASATAYGLACLELEAGDSSVRTLVSVQGSLAMHALAQWGSQQQKDQWLPKLRSGESIGCFALTEAGFGSDPAGMATHARRLGDDWVLDGAKKWITNGSIADVAIIWAQTDDKIRGFVVPTDTPGFSARDIPGKLSLRASTTSELRLDGVRLPGSALLPGARGLSAPLACLNDARFGIIFGALGAAQDSLESTLEYSRNRQIFDKPLASYQATQLKIADMAVELGKGTLLALHLGRLKEAGTLRSEQVSVGKLNSVRTALAIARECRAILGANGITLDYSPLRHANNLESVMTYEGTSEVHQLIIGQALTGHAAFR
ncbi:acyl-CoA dehydrogenase family protein [Pseudomonas sp. MRSN 12121]|uniref:acyl-CoA dehydrogenase family protein n=1 Tax=Pseudomonas sp. MRSN 12121 TaxID=1611770 RepID=UPI0005BECE9A|nr:acyl-CoA dehydrogenase family protein [Pseudomonas sp. MRSN 12121]AJO78657.1 acyl-CoA dehydrogenase [Pseudomonas sp. MRSN 12121]